MNRHPAPAARRSRSYLRFAVGWGKAMGREGVSFGFPVLGHPRDLGGRRGSRRVRVHLREFFLVHRLPLCPVGRYFRLRLLLGLPQPRCLLCCGRGEMEGSDSVRGESGVVAVRMRAWSAWVRTLTSGVHDCLCLLLGGEEPLDTVLRFHGCACPGENCRSPRRNFPSTFEDETQLSNFAEVINLTDCTDTV